MSDRSRPVLRVVSDPLVDDVEDELLADDLVADLLSCPAATNQPLGRPDMAGLRGEIDADVARLVDRGGRFGSTDLLARWDAVRRLCEPADLGHLADHAESLYEAADSVRRQHTGTADGLGPLWDAWQGPAAEAVQDRVSALARSAHALVAELETTAACLRDARDSIVEAVEYLADDLAGRPAGAHENPAVWDRATSTCARAWDDARRVLAGGVAPDVSRPGRLSP